MLRPTRPGPGAAKSPAATAAPGHDDNRLEAPRSEKVRPENSEGAVPGLLSTDAAPREGWSPGASEELYGMGAWGKGYFAINERGHVVVRPERNSEGEIDVYEVVRGVAERGVQAPVLLRFSEITTHRARDLRATFQEVIVQAQYEGDYCCVYPIKVNQQRHICEEIRDMAAALQFGLEAGSKPELLAVMALAAEHPQMPIICNGFKDDRYAETAMLASRMGLNVIPVIEKLSELDLFIEHARRRGVRPTFGVRAKLASPGSGRWQHSAGQRSKFGLSIAEVLELVEKLRAEDMLDCLKLLHCHIGSQVSDILRIKNAVTELSHIYTELVRLGAPMGMLDIGGGLGVDYDGTQSTGDSSVNYGLQEYCSDVIWRIMTTCNEKEVAHPMLITESGRAIAAYGTLLVFDVLGRSNEEATPDLDGIKKLVESESESPQPLLDLLDCYERGMSGPFLELLHDLIQAREEAMMLFGLGYLSLPIRAATEQLHRAVARMLLQRVRDGELEDLPEEFEEVEQLLIDTYYCNFSLFQSLPDSWAIEQVFPVCPLHRHLEEPHRKAILADITCDSDGRIDRFAEGGSGGQLVLHDPLDHPDSPYYLGVFLVGAYQETLGDLHNLFGDTHAVHVGRHEDGDWVIEEIVEGDRVRDVLGYVQFDTNEMRRKIARRLEHSVRAGSITVAESRSMRRFYERGLIEYTYLGAPEGDGEDAS